MRNIINVSMPKNMASFVRKEAKRNKCASTSEFVRLLVREYEEQLVLEELEKSRQEYRQGKAKTLKSIDDLK